MDRGIRVWWDTAGVVPGFAEASTMRLDSVRELKTVLTETVVMPLATAVRTRAALGVAARPVSDTAEVPATLALGIVPAGRDDFKLAVRVQQRILENSPQIDTIRRQARGEVEVRYIGRLTKRTAPPWHQKRNRPLRIGGSVGHFKVTAGTLGGFVRRRGTKEPLILSNNHVLANENRARTGDAILQPGNIDGGQPPEAAVGMLLRVVRLKKTGANLVDCAVAAVDEGVKFNRSNLTGLGKLAGVGDVLLDEVPDVAKVGRTTGTTRGRVTAFELDNVLVNNGLGLIRFDDQIEIEGAEAGPFSQGGDSGSLIVNAARQAVALLFAGGDLGGSNGQGLTYANPIGAVFGALNIELFR
jgi:hypothetical protein